MDESRASNLSNFSSLSGSLAPGSDSTIDGNGEPLFVINLCAAMTPIDLTGQTLGDLNQYRVYQVSRMEDGRRRYRLRLGFFTTESHAEDVLASVRGRYATAFTSRLCEEDLKNAAGYLKCTVKDLESTGRYAVQKLRGDSGGTTALRVITPAALQQLQAAESQSAEPTRAAAPAPTKPATTMASVLPISVLPTKVPSFQPSAPTPLRNTTPAVTPAIERRQPSSPLRATPATKPGDHTSVFVGTKSAAFTPSAPQPKAAEQTLSLKALIMTPENAPKRQSLMQRAHAMAPMDAVDRAKGVPGTAASAFVNTLATGKFKLPTSTATAAIAAPPAARPVIRPAMQVPTRAPTQVPTQAPTQAAPIASRPIAPAVTPAPSLAAKAPNPTPSISLEAHTPPRATAAPIQQRNQAFHVGAGVNIPETSLSLALAEPRTQTKAPTTPSIAPAAIQVSPVVTTAPATSTNDLSRVRELAKQSIQWRQDHGEVPTLDTTQTIRALTKTELEDTNRAKWFTVQLAISDHPANLDTMPKLDIFDAYSLYSVAVMEGSGIRHALRLGFFREEVSAMAVLGYLKTFFSEPVIARIADAEYERFINAPKLSALTKAASNNITLDEKHAAKHSPIEDHVPTISAAVTRTASMSKQQPKPMARAAAPATKRAPAPPIGKKPATPNAKFKGGTQQDLLDEAQLLGLSDTAILRAQKNPSLLSRLVGKMGK